MRAREKFSGVLFDPGWFHRLARGCRLDTGMRTHGSADVNPDNVRPLACKGDSHRASDPPGGTRDNSNLGSEATVFSRA